MPEQAAATASVEQIHGHGVATAFRDDRAEGLPGATAEEQVVVGGEVAGDRGTETATAAGDQGCGTHAVEPMVDSLKGRRRGRRRRVLLGFHCERRWIRHPDADTVTRPVPLRSPTSQVLQWC